MKKDYKFIKKGKLVYFGGCSLIPKGDYKVVDITEEEIDDNTVILLESDKTRNGTHAVFADELIESDNETYE